MAQEETNSIFMMCSSLRKEAFSEMPSGFYIRNCKRKELNTWKEMPFDTKKEVKEYRPFMDEFYQTTYSKDEELFFNRTLFVCDQMDNPVATCLIWKAYDKFNSLHWLKVKKNYEGIGLGRALISAIFKKLNKIDYPVYLHTHPECNRAIKLYSDFGFKLLNDKSFGGRKNNLKGGLEILKKSMPYEDFERLEIIKAPRLFHQQLAGEKTIQF